MSERETAAAGRINWRRILPILLTTSLVGSVCGIFVINELDRQHDGAHLASYTEMALERALEISSAAEQMLHEMNAGGPAACSDQDLEALRSIVLESRFMSDVGRVSGNRIVCTGVRGRLRSPWGWLRPTGSTPEAPASGRRACPCPCRCCLPAWSGAATPSSSSPRMLRCRPPGPGHLGGGRQPRRRLHLPPFRLGRRPAPRGARPARLAALHRRPADKPVRPDAGHLRGLPSP